MKCYIMETFGDLPSKGLSGPKLFTTLTEALRFLEDTFPLDLLTEDDLIESGKHGDPACGAPGDILGLAHNSLNNNLWLDPEDDRILIYEVDTKVIENTEKNPSIKLVWHFSGWHWEYDAGDIVGGPLEQGSLPRDNGKSLYSLATIS